MLPSRHRQIMKTEGWKQLPASDINFFVGVITGEENKKRFRSATGDGNLYSSGFYRDDLGSDLCFIFK